MIFLIHFVTDLDECDDLDVCGPQQTCENTADGYNCKCAEGYAVSGKNCTGRPCSAADCTKYSAFSDGSASVLKKKSAGSDVKHELKLF